MKLADVFELFSLKHLLIELIWKLVFLLIIAVLLLLIGMITCFLEGIFIVMLIFGLTGLDLLMMLFISIIFLSDTVRNIFLIWMMFSILIFKACVYGFLLLTDKVNLLLFDFNGSGGEFDLESLETVRKFLMKYKDMH